MAAPERLREAVPPEVREVCRALGAAGHQALTVGGAVRDALLGRTPGDWDVATSAHPDQVMALFRKTIPTGLQHGTVTVMVGRGASRTRGRGDDVPRRGRVLGRAAAGLAWCSGCRSTRTWRDATS